MSDYPDPAYFATPDPPQPGLVHARRGSSADWAAWTEPLEASRLGQDSDTGEVRVGDGASLWADLTPVGGSGASGAPIIVEHAFTFSDAAALLAGVTLYTPAVGDYLLDVWVEETVGFDATAKLDVGTFNGDTFGLFGAGNGALDLAALNYDDMGGIAVLSSGAPSLAAQSYFNGYAMTPARFTDVNPLKVIVSTTGASNGSQIASTAGAATVKALILPAA